MIVEGLKELDIFGLMIPEEYGGLGESLLTYALAVEEIARGWMSLPGVINTHFIVAYMLMQHGTDEQEQKYLPNMATARSRLLLDVGARAGVRRGGDQDQGREDSARRRERRVHDHRAEDVADQRWARRTWLRCWSRPRRARTRSTRT